MSDTDLFGQPIESRGALTDAERRKLRRRASEKPKGHAFHPGSGPAGETCRSCVHKVRIGLSKKTVHKCGLVRRKWTASVRTDIRLRDPACRHWEAEAPDFNAHRHPVLAVACPTCHAAVGVWCKRPSGHRATDLHAGRKCAADAAWEAAGRPEILSLGSKAPS